MLKHRHLVEAQESHQVVCQNTRRAVRAGLLRPAAAARFTTSNANTLQLLMAIFANERAPAANDDRPTTSEGKTYPTLAAVHQVIT